MEIIKANEFKRNVEYSREFAHEQGGYSFPCNSKGEPLKFSPSSKKHWDQCISGELEVEDRGIKKYVSFYRSPAVGKCDCGREVELYDPLDNFCGCGECYNSSGQRVTPSSDCDDQGNPYECEF